MSDLQRVRTWATALIRMYLDESWSFDFDNAKQRAGLCNFSRKRITVSRYLAARFDDEEIYQTLLHEVAHAIVGNDAGHGPVWKQVARELGYVGGVTHRGETATELAPWVGVCPSGHTIHRHRRPPRAVSCARCSRTFDVRFAITWTRRTITAAMRQAALTPREHAPAASALTGTGASALTGDSESALTGEAASELTGTGAAAR